MYNLEQLRMLVETAELGSFSACARKLGKVQSAVSQGIANLEIDLGVTLFDRSTRKPSLTPEGERLVRHAWAVLQQAQELNTAAAAASRLEETQITLAMDRALLMPAFTRTLREFSERFKATALKLITVTSADVVDHIERGQADIGLMFCDLSFRREVELCFIGNLPIYPVCGVGHPLSQQASVSVTDLTLHRQIVEQGEKRGGSEYVAQISADVWWANNIETILTLVKAGLGWSYLPCHLAEPLVAAGQLHRLPVDFDDKAWSSPVDLITAKHSAKGPALDWLHRRLKSLLDA